jgi:hypothetical protein
MDILVDIIVYLLRKFATANPPPVRPPSPQELAAHQAVMKQRLETMQKAMTAREARTQPRSGPRAVAKRAAPARASISQPSVKRASPAPPLSSVPPVQQPAKSPAYLPGWKAPLILGEILAPPLALRDPEI